MKRSNKRFYKSRSTEELVSYINACFNETSQLADSLISGRFIGSANSGTSLESLDVFRACRTSLQNIESVFIRNSVLSLLHNSHQSHHSLAAFLSAYFMGHTCKATPTDVMLESRCATAGDADKIYDFLIRDGRTRNVFNRIRQIAGSSARISIQMTPAKEDTVIYRQHNVYPLQIPQEFWRYTSKDELEFINVNVLAVDGVIMSVGEINGCLLTAYESKQPFILLCRGMSQEVLATLLKNYAMGKLNVFPIQISTGEMANFLYDVSYLAGAHVVSTITGDVLASKGAECWGSFEHIVVRKDTLEIDVRNKKLASDLVKKIETERKNYMNEFGSVGEFMHIFEGRKNAASSEMCKVYISKVGIGPAEIITDRLKSLILIHNEIKENGIVDLRAFEEKRFRDLENAGLVSLPTTSLIHALRASGDLRSKILESSKVLMLD